ncbi:MAG: tetratricopeptide repeat protein [Acidobacteriota bacterium]
MNNRIRNGIIALAVVAAWASTALGQSPPASSVTAEMRTAANDAYQKQDWTASAARYEKIVKAEEKNPGAHYRLGVSLLNLERINEARPQLEMAMSISPNAIFALALARCYAKIGSKDKMYEVFEKSIALGGISAASLNDEKDFAAVKAEPKFFEYVKKLDAVANPCRSRPEFRQFDFWIGEWAPQNAQGVTVGTSSIQLILGDCIIFENWNTPVSSGKSFNLFDTRDNKWHQTWVDAQGSMTQYVGGMQDGKMVLVADTTANGNKSLARMTFSKLPGGNVRQLGESSTDDGKTWLTTFDFTYVKKK